MSGPGPDIALEPDRDACAAAVASLLADLPDWFGVPENDARYAEASRRHPSWLARGAREVLGVLTLTAPTEEARDVHLLAVRRGWHRRGLGRALVAAAEARARAEGARALTVRTLGPSHPSRAYAGTRSAYAALGFVALAELEGVWGDGVPMLLMCRPIEPGEETPR